MNTNFQQIKMWYCNIILSKGEVQIGINISESIFLKIKYLPIFYSYFLSGIL